MIQFDEGLLNIHEGSSCNPNDSDDDALVNTDNLRIIQRRLDDASNSGILATKPTGRRNAQEEPFFTVGFTQEIT